MSRGFCGIGIVNGKSAVNVGTLWRSAHAMGADFIFTVGRRYARQCSDTTSAWRHVPLFSFARVEDLVESMPRESLLVVLYDRLRQRG